jgi:hypothetical protein
MTELGCKSRSIILLALLCSTPFVWSCNNNQLAGDGTAKSCGSPETYETIKKIVFDNAVSSAVDGSVMINDWRKLTSLTVENPLVSGVNKEIARTDCVGRIIISIPESERQKFGGEAQIKADVTYFAQPSADGKGDVISVDGIAPIVNRIVEANASAIGLLEANRIENERVQANAKAQAIAKAGGPQLQATYNPSFDCTGRLKNVERMICQDEGLASLDRNLSATFRNKIVSLDVGYKQPILAEQRQNLAARANCPDIACLYEWYNNNQNWVDAL